MAQEWVDHLKATGKFEHSDREFHGDSLGENLASLGFVGTNFTGIT